MENPQCKIKVALEQELSHSGFSLAKRFNWLPKLFHPLLQNDNYKLLTLDDRNKMQN